ncbi:MAG: hypothetical protein V2B19_17475 [Pseudomonadota bacterium]
MRFFLLPLLVALACLDGCSFVNKITGVREFRMEPLVAVDLSSYCRLVNLPDINVVNTAQIGDSMVSAFKAAELPALRLKEPVQHAAQYKNAEKIIITIPEGILELKGHNQRGGQFFANKTLIHYSMEYSDGKSGGPWEVPGGIFIDADGTPWVFWDWGGGPKLSADSSLKIEKTTVTLEPTDLKFKREILYSGRTRSTILLHYREFSNDMARPAFSQNLTYDSAIGAIIGFRGGRFEIIDADNTSITYKVLTHLN